MAVFCASGREARPTPSGCSLEGPCLRRVDPAWQGRVNTTQIQVAMHKKAYLYLIVSINVDRLIILDMGIMLAH